MSYPGDQKCSDRNTLEYLRSFPKVRFVAGAKGQHPAYDSAPVHFESCLRTPEDPSHSATLLHPDIPRSRHAHKALP